MNLVVCARIMVVITLKSTKYCGIFININLSALCLILMNPIYVLTMIAAEGGNSACDYDMKGLTA